MHITVARGTLGSYPGIGPIPAQDVKYSTPNYNIEQVQSSLIATRETVQLYKKEVERVISDYVAKQTALESGLLQAEASLAEAEQSEIALSNQEAKQKEQLNDLLGRDVLTEFAVSAIGEEAASSKVEEMAEPAVVGMSR